MSKSTLSTAAAISNSMIGTTLILFPITFNQSGIIANSLVIVPLILLRLSWVRSLPLPANCLSLTSNLKSLM